MIAVQRAAERRKNLSGSDILGLVSVVQYCSRRDPILYDMSNLSAFVSTKRWQVFNRFNEHKTELKNLQSFEDVEKGESVNPYV